MAARPRFPTRRAPRSGKGASKSRRSIGRPSGAIGFSTRPGSRMSSSTAPVARSSSASIPGRGSTTARCTRAGSRWRRIERRLRGGPPFRTVSFTKRTRTGVVATRGWRMTQEAYGPEVARVRQRVDGTEAVWTSSLSARDGADYDELVEVRGHLLQSRAFAPVARAGRPRSLRWIVVRSGGRAVGAAQVLCLGPVAWVERGPTAAPGWLGETLAAVERAARRHGVIHLTVSPAVLDAEAEGAASQLAARAYRPVLAHDGLHRVTGRLDLLEDPLDAPERAKLRRESRRALRHGAQVEPDGDASLLARLARRPGAWARAVTGLAHGGAAAVLVGRDGSGPVAAALVAAHGGVAT